MNPGAEPADDAAQPLRSDAERNRARIIAGRAHGVRERRPERLDGLGGPPGGVGIATLFRRFPTKEDLVAAVFADRMDAYAEVVADALDDPDPWHGLVGIIESVCAMQAADYGFADVLTMTFPTATALEQRRLEVYHAVVQLIDRAKAAGRLREDFTPEDLVLVYMANAGVVNAAGDHVPDAWRRVVTLMIQSFEAPARGPLPDSPAPDALYKAMLRASQASCASPHPGKSS